MKNKIIFSFLIIFSICLFAAPHKANASCDVGMIEQEYNAVGLGGSALENSAVQNCMDEQQQDFQNNLNQIQNRYDQQNQEELQQIQQRQQNQTQQQPQQTQQEQQAVTAEVYSQKCQSLYGSNVVWDGTFNSNNGLNCTCTKGFSWNKVKTACVTNNQACAESFGNNSVWLGNYGSNGEVICSCAQGFTMNKEKICMANSLVCSNDYGSNSVWNGKLNDGGSAMCDCADGFTWNSDGTACIALPTVPETINQNNNPVVVQQPTNKIVKTPPVENVVTEEAPLVPATENTQNQESIFSGQPLLNQGVDGGGGGGDNNQADQNNQSNNIFLNIWNFIKNIFGKK